MGQYWEVAAYERFETLGNWFKIGEFLPTHLPKRIVHLLAFPALGSEDNPDPILKDGRAPHSQSSQENCALLQLPVEILLLISDGLDLNSVCTLTVSSWALRNLLRNKLDTRFRETLAPWAYTPLMCVGDGMTINPPIIDPEIFADFTPDPDLEQEYLPEYTYQLTVQAYMAHMNPPYALDSSICISPPFVNQALPPWGFTRPKWENYCRGTAPWKKTLYLQKYFPPGRRWVLRNFNTKEYVYAYLFTSLDGKGNRGFDQPDAKADWGYNLGTLVLVNTCWSDNESTSMLGLNVMGRWVGHCFDIADEARLFAEAEATGGGWVDVSVREHAAMRELYQINEWNALDASEEHA